MVIDLGVCFLSSFLVQIIKELEKDKSLEIPFLKNCNQLFWPILLLIERNGRLHTQNVTLNSFVAKSL